MELVIGLALYFGCLYMLYKVYEKVEQEEKE